MGFVVREFSINGEKVLDFLVEKLGFTPREAKRAIDRGRVSIDGKPVREKGEKGRGILKCIIFEPNGYGLTPFFETLHFAVFDKPSGVAIHPKKLANTRSLLDDVRRLYGNGANLVHRLDKETSGVVIASKNRVAERILKQAFQNREVEKGYLALVEGVIPRRLTIKKPIAVNRNEEIKVKVTISPTGKSATTLVKPLEVIDNRFTLVEVTPLTGRQHQIRVHLWSIGHRIVGDPLYGVPNPIADRYLKKELTPKERIFWSGAPRLMLHAHRLQFTFFGNRYHLVSPTNFREEIGKILPFSSAIKGEK
jgi:23S rRNA pseudouridine1911/1915/1917 synthase